MSRKNPLEDFKKERKKIKKYAKIRQKRLPNFLQSYIIDTDFERSSAFFGCDEESHSGLRAFRK